MTSRTTMLALGETMKGTDANDNLINDEMLGQIREFRATNSTGQLRSARPVRAVLLRNTSGATLYGKRIGRCKKTAGKSLVTVCDGYNIDFAEGPCVIIDDKLASSGVANNDIFWGIIDGEVEALTPLAGAEFNATGIAVGDSLVAITGSTTGATTSGRIGGYALANATDAAGAYKQARNSIGRALSARTSGETNSAILINACIKW